MTPGHLKLALERSAAHPAGPVGETEPNSDWFVQKEISRQRRRETV